MAKKVQVRRETTANLAGIIPALAEVGVDTAKKCLLAGDGAQAGGFPHMRAPMYLTKAGAYTLVAADYGRFVSASAALTFTLPPAATVKAHWCAWLHNRSTGTATVDGNAAETINGNATIKLEEDEAVLLVCDGSNWLIAADTRLSGLATIAGNVPVGDGSGWVAEGGNTLRTSLGIANHDQITVSAAGEVTMPSQPSFLAYNSAGDANVTGNGATVTVEFDTEIEDRGGDYNNATDTFTASITGPHDIAAQVNITGLVSASSVVLRLVTSNRTYYRQWNSPPDGAFTALIVVPRADFDAGDTAIVTVQVNGMAGDTADIQGGATLETFFSGGLAA